MVHYAGCVEREDRESGEVDCGGEKGEVVRDAELAAMRRAGLRACVASDVQSCARLSAACAVAPRHPGSRCNGRVRREEFGAWRGRSGATGLWGCGALLSQRARVQWHRTPRCRAPSFRGAEHDEHASGHVTVPVPGVDVEVVLRETDRLRRRGCTLTLASQRQPRSARPGPPCRRSCRRRSATAVVAAGGRRRLGLRQHVAQRSPAGAASPTLPPVTSVAVMISESGSIAMWPL